MTITKEDTQKPLPTIPNVVPPSATDLIDKKRLSADYKDVPQLLDDITYFLKTFPLILKSEQKLFNSIDKKSLVKLQKLHRKIVGKLAPTLRQEEKAAGGKKLGIVVDADEYISGILKRLLAESAFQGLTAGQLVVNINDPASAKKSGTKSMGSFEVVKGTSGRLAAQREPVYRAIPDTNEAMLISQTQRPRPVRIGDIKARFSNLVTTAQTYDSNNPFLKSTKTTRIKYVL
jgi:hypothetical protein